MSVRKYFRKSAIKKAFNITASSLEIENLQNVVKKENAYFYSKNTAVYIIHSVIIREAAKKVIFLVAGY